MRISITPAFLALSLVLTSVAAYPIIETRADVDAIRADDLATGDIDSLHHLYARAPNDDEKARRKAKLEAEKKARKQAEEEESKRYRERERARFAQEARNQSQRLLQAEQQSAAIMQAARASGQGLPSDAYYRNHAPVPTNQQIMANERAATARLQSNYQAGLPYQGARHYGEPDRDISQYTSNAGVNAHPNPAPSTLRQAQRPSTHSTKHPSGSSTSTRQSAPGSSRPRPDVDLPHGSSLGAMLPPMPQAGPSSHAPQSSMGHSSSSGTTRHSGSTMPPAGSHASGSGSYPASSSTRHTTSAMPPPGSHASGSGSHAASSSAQHDTRLNTSMGTPYGTPPATMHGGVPAQAQYYGGSGHSAPPITPSTSHGMPGQQHYPPPPAPQQVYPQQHYPQQGYPQQGYPQQGYPQQAYPQHPGVVPPHTGMPSGGPSTSSLADWAAPPVIAPAAPRTGAGQPRPLARPSGSSSTTTPPTAGGSNSNPRPPPSGGAGGSSSSSLADWNKGHN
ncbi:hypothetical protein K474DRAFT_1669272 [Panus rudis PR-1116 ss-1]|nr:hypothetical protein K474DRAFT_1669272 [Panus rudis PR-1116 ss-1]